MLLPPAEVWQLAPLTGLQRHQADFMGADEPSAHTQQHSAHNKHTCLISSTLVRAGQACIMA